MGYFARKLSRSRCADQCEAALRTQAEHLLTVGAEAGWCWTNVDDLAAQPDQWRRPRADFLRFAVGFIDARSGEPRGLFRAAGRLEASPSLPRPSRAALRRAFWWFNRNLAFPPRSRIAPRCVFWFRGSSAACVSHMWELVQIFRDEGVPVWVMRTSYPGYIAYADEHQVAAVPCRQLPARRRCF